MFCGFCGEEIENNSKFCSYCGTIVEDKSDIHWEYFKSQKSENSQTNINNQMSENSQTNINNQMSKNFQTSRNDLYKEIFVEPDEVFIDLFGNGYVNSFFSTGAIKRCVALLSDKRVYLRGNMLDASIGKIERVNVQKTIDLEDITGTGFVYESAQIWKLIVAVVSMNVTILATILLIALYWRSWGVIIGVAIPVIIAAIILLVSYLKNRGTTFLIEYAGGCIKFDVSIYPLVESQDFEKQIRRAKNKIKEKI